MLNSSISFYPINNVNSSSKTSVNTQCSKDPLANEFGLEFKEIYLLPKSFQSQSRRPTQAQARPECPFLIDFDAFLTVTRGSPNFDSLVNNSSLKKGDYLLHEDEEEEMMLTLIHSNFKQEIFYFDIVEELIRTETILNSLNKSEDRHLAVLVNPISGKQRGRGYYKDILAPTLNITGIKYDHYETDSETYIEEWVNQFSEKPFPYTDIILIGGDGLFSQLINSVLNNPECKHLIKTPIGLLPAGSQNAVCCDLKGKDVFQACRNIVRRPTVQTDIMKVQFANSDTPIYATVILWGLLGDVVKNAEKLRKLFKSARYAVSAAKIFLTSWKMKTYKCNVQFKSDFETNSDFNARKHLDEEDGKNDVGLNISSSIQTESTEATEGSEIGENPWNDHPDSDFSFLGMVTHECRSSLNKKERFMPTSRFNDGSISLATLTKCGKVKLLKFLSKFSNAKHLEFDKFNGMEVSEVQISPDTKSWFNIDGEIYENDQANVKLLPSFLTMIGGIHDS